MKICDSPRRQLQRAAIFSPDSIDCATALRGRHADRGRGELHPVKFGRQIDKRTIAALSHVGDYLRNRAVDAGAVAASAREYRGQKFSELWRLRLKNPWPHADSTL